MLLYHINAKGLQLIRGYVMVNPNSYTHNEGPGRGAGVGVKFLLGLPAGAHFSQKERC